MNRAKWLQMMMQLLLMHPWRGGAHSRMCHRDLVSHWNTNSCALNGSAFINIGIFLLLALQALLSYSADTSASGKPLWTLRWWGEYSYLSFTLFWFSLLTVFVGAWLPTIDGQHSRYHGLAKARCVPVSKQGESTCSVWIPWSPVSLFNARHKCRVFSVVY